jgi:hypothetical protein
VLAYGQRFVLREEAMAEAEGHCHDVATTGEDWSGFRRIPVDGRNARNWCVDEPYRQKSHAITKLENRAIRVQIPPRTAARRRVAMFAGRVVRFARVIPLTGGLCVIVRVREAARTLAFTCVRRFARECERDSSART